ncbi:MAG: hypothetical protein JWN81_162 [Solirubrobacterales bacterium]|nr:hypothetical protein [Solirubrobacterales bacterium]
MRVVVLGAAMMAALAGCGAQSRVVQLKPLTPSEARNLIRNIKPGCNLPGRVLITYTEPEVHGHGGWTSWCVEPAQAYRTVSRDLHCPARTRLTIDFERHLAACENSN